MDREVILFLLYVTASLCYSNYTEFFGYGDGSGLGIGAVCGVLCGVSRRCSLRQPALAFGVVWNKSSRARGTRAVFPELDIAFGTQGAALDEVAIVSHEVFDGDGLVGEDLARVRQRRAVAGARDEGSPLDGH